MSGLKERLISEREKAGYSQQQLADKANCSQATIADIERGRNHDSKKIPNIAAALKLHAIWLKDGRGPKYLDDRHLPEDGIYITDPEIAAIARILQDARQSGDDYLVEITRKDLDAHAELIAKAEARGRAKDY